MESCHLVFVIDCAGTDLSADLHQLLSQTRMVDLQYA